MFSISPCVQNRVIRWEWEMNELSLVSVFFDTWIAYFLLQRNNWLYCSNRSNRNEKCHLIPLVSFPPLNWYNFWVGFSFINLKSDSPDSVVWVCPSKWHKHSKHSKWSIFWVSVSLSKNKQTWIFPVCMPDEQGYFLILWLSPCENRPGWVVSLWVSFGLWLLPEKAVWEDQDLSLG